MKCCISGGNIIRILFLFTELFKFEIQKCGQILCAHKPYFLMPGHIYGTDGFLSVFVTGLKTVPGHPGHIFSGSSESDPLDCTIRVFQLFGV